MKSVKWETHKLFHYKGFFTRELTLLLLKLHLVQLVYLFKGFLDFLVTATNYT